MTEGGVDEDVMVVDNDKIDQNSVSNGGVVGEGVEEKVIGWRVERRLEDLSFASEIKGHRAVGEGFH